MFQVVKRDGEIAEFQMAKITSAIDKAFDAKEKNYSKDMIDLLALRVTADFQNKIQDGKVTVEDIQDSVENVLIQAGYSDVAKAYILYRKQRERDRGQLCEGRGLASKRELYCHIFGRWSDPEQFRCSYSQLLVIRDL